MQNINNSRKKIRIIKYFFLLAGVIVLLSIIIFYLNKNPLIEQNSENNKIKKVSDQFSLSIINTVFEGFNKKNLPYKILAQTVTKKDNNIYDLNQIIADYKIANGILEILAEQGVLNDLTKSFILSKNVKIMFDGLVLTSDKINFDLNKNSASSKHPVEVNYDNFTIKALEFNTLDEYNVINFKGNVESTLLPIDKKTTVTKNNKKIIVKSENLTVDNKGHLAGFTGEVTIFFDDMILKTKHLNIYYDQDSHAKTITKIEIPGRLKAMKAITNEIILADKGEYVVATNELKFRGNVVLNRDKNIVVTDEMTYITKYKKLEQH